MLDFNKKIKIHSLEALAPEAPGFFFWKTSNSHYLGMSHWICNMLGLSSPQECIGKSDYDFIWSESADICITHDKIAMHHGCWQGIENGKTIFNTHTVPFISWKSPIYNELNQIAGVYWQGMPAASLIKPLQKWLSELIENDPKCLPGDKINSYSFNKTPQFTDLTHREKECLFWLIRGKPTKLIGRYLHISPRTVESHIEKIKLKWHCITKSELIDYALEKGFAEIIPHF